MPFSGYGCLRIILWRRNFTEPSPHMEHLPLEPLTEEELEAYNYFSSEDYTIIYDDGKTVKSKEPLHWLPHSKYILGDKPLSAFLLSPAHENGKYCCRISLSDDDNKT